MPQPKAKKGKKKKKAEEEPPADGEEPEKKKKKKKKKEKKSDVPEPIQWIQQKDMSVQEAMAQAHSWTTMNKVS